MFFTRRLEDNPELNGTDALKAWDSRLAAASVAGANAREEEQVLSDQQRAFWTNICICNTLIVERGPDGEYVYQVRRPDFLIHKFHHRAVSALLSASAALS